jgi:hypothetical protein
MSGFVYLALSLFTLVCGILAFCGKGGWIVAGFFGSKNAERIDRKKAFRIIGVMNVVDCVFFAVLSYFSFYPLSVGSPESYSVRLLAVAVALYFLSTILVGCYLNFCCKK